jgi:predicted nucleic acid-binding protein
VSAFVGDTSVFGPMIFEDEADSLVPTVLDLLREGGVLVPQHWPLEISNMVLVGVRRRRIKAENLSPIIDILSGLSIEMDTLAVEHICSVGLTLAQKHDLTIYDAAYLELAIRTQLPLATLDKALVCAARGEKIEILTL